ncbi:MAG: 2-oxoglutarate dehydrogenase complex dihydrolipoyllysine-residue succinyltransferase [Alphaproteobacteria bacterium]|nr:2-oxoglutarate dehydrogenase complex dihydrolipoyllysine-residue succinyltransferase [Alphaproteobacteria bacterium]
MTVKIEAPTMGESISEATVAKWLKAEGEFVQQDELIAELETDKVNLEVNAPQAGKLMKIMTGEGDTVSPGDSMGEIDESAEGGATPAAAEEAPAEAPKTAAPATAAVSLPDDLSPAVRRMVEENSLNAADIAGTGKGGRLTKEDVQKFMKGGAVKAPASTPAPVAKQNTAEREERVKMSKLRQVIAGRLKTSQNTAAMLTTYNEVDLTKVMELRKSYQDQFVKKNDIKLGFMSFFTKAAIDALKAWPALNAEIDGDEIVYKNYYNMGIAVSTERGLVVPVIRDADQMSFAEIEKSIAGFGAKARDGKLMPDDMAGGTFTITNGGVFGSMMSMPILNYPQVGILGMHSIQQRPVAVDGKVEIRPMMYLAMTYDHRIVDGREAVSFVKHIKEVLEDPGRLLIGV